MRDIRPSGSMKRPKRSDGGASDGEAPKRKPRKGTRIARPLGAVPPHDPDSQKQAEPHAEAEAGFDWGGRRRTRSAKGRLAGSTVPVAPIHVPKDDPGEVNWIPAAREEQGEDETEVSKPPSGRSRKKQKKQRRAKRAKRRTQKKSRPSGKPRARIGHGERVVLLLFLLLALLAGGVALVIFLPTAQVNLQLKTAPLLVDEELTVAARGDSATVPGTAFFREIPITGTLPVDTIELRGTKARGSVQLVNETTEEQKIKERSRLVTDEDQLFYLEKAAFVPPQSRVTVTVEADQAGPEGNIEPQRLDFAALDSSAQQVLYAEVVEALTEGSGEEIRVVGEADVEAARQAAAESARSQAEVEVQEELPTGWALLDESWEAEFEEFVADAEVGETTPELAYEARVIVRVMGIELAALEGVLRELLESKLTGDFRLFPGAISYTKTVDEVNWEQAQAVLRTRVTHTTIPNLSLETLQEKIAGRSLAEAQGYLEGLPGVRKVDISLWPFWARSIPRIEDRISLDVEADNQP